MGQCKANWKNGRTCPYQDSAYCGNCLKTFCGHHMSREDPNYCQLCFEYLKNAPVKEKLAKKLRRALLDEALIHFEPFETDSIYDRLLAEILEVLKFYTVEEVS